MESRSFSLLVLVLQRRSNHGQHNRAHPSSACEFWIGTRYAQSNEVCHHGQGGLVALQRQPQLLHVSPYGHPSVFLVPCREPQSVADVHVPFDLVHDACAVLQQGRSPLGQCLGKACRVIFQDVEDAVEGMELGEDCIELCPCLPDLPDEASQGRGRLGDCIVGRKACRRDGSGKDGGCLLVPCRPLNQS